MEAETDLEIWSHQAMSIWVGVSGAAAWWQGRGTQKKTLHTRQKMSVPVLINEGVVVVGLLGEGKAFLTPKPVH